jgi:hypothetical protein
MRLVDLRLVLPHHKHHVRLPCPAPFAEGLDTHPPCSLGLRSPVSLSDLFFPIVIITLGGNLDQSTRHRIRYKHATNTLSRSPAIYLHPFCTNMLNSLSVQSLDRHPSQEPHAMLEVRTRRTERKAREPHPHISHTRKNTSAI